MSEQWKRIVREQGPGVYRIAWRILGNADDADEVVQDVFLQSPKGHWYPTRVRRTHARPDVQDQILEYHVEFDVNIPDALFEVKKPLLVEEVL